MVQGSPLRSRTAIRKLLIVIPVLVGAGMTQPDALLWFDSIQRMPVKTTQVEGFRMSYLDAGQGSPVILVHGFSGSMWQFEYQQAPLSAALRVITPDLLGSGLSDKPELPYAPAQQVELFRGFMDALDIQRAALVGHSMGAGLVIGMALTYPERVDRLVLIDGFPDHVRDKLASPTLKRMIDTEVPVWVVELGNWLFGGSTTTAMLGEAIYDHRLLTPLVLERSRQNRNRPGLIPPLMTLPKNLPLWEEGFAKRFGEIRQPTLILWGAEDRLFPPPVGQALHTAIAGSTFSLIPEAGHIPQWERPDVATPILLKFLQR
ncbi:MAG: alpha/beta fold hydrolase [Nitrospiraceae bacterium]